MGFVNDTTTEVVKVGVDRDIFGVQRLGIIYIIDAEK